MTEEKKVVKATNLHFEYPEVSDSIIRSIVARPEFAKFEVASGCNPLRFYDTLEFRRLLVENIQEHKTRKLRRSKCIGYRHH